MSLEINNALSPVENIVALIHHTYPASIGYIDETNYTFVASVIDPSEYGDTALTITALESASLTGKKEVDYYRYVIGKPEQSTSAPDIATYEASEEFTLLGEEGVDWTRESVEENDGRTGTLYTYTATDDSLLYFGYFNVFIAAAGPVTVEEIVDGESLDGFTVPG